MPCRGPFSSRSTPGCGCARLCGVSRQGDPVGEVYNLSGQPPTRNLEPLVCLKCYRDKRFAVERTVRRGILWADSPERAFSERTAAAIIVLLLVFRNMPVGIQSGTAALQQIDASIEDELNRRLAAALPVEVVYARGQRVAEAGAVLVDCPHLDWPAHVRDTVHLGKTLAPSDFEIAAPVGANTVTAKVIGVGRQE